MIKFDKMVPLEQAKKLSLHVEKPIGRSGTWRLAQKIRRWSHYQTYLSGPYKWAHPVIETEMQLCATVQRESFLKEEIQNVHTNSIGHDEKQLQNWAEELVLLDQEYWRLERILYIARCNGVPGEPAREAYFSLREKPGWHLKSKWLREDCAKRGGCCGRQCKCCERSPDFHRMKGWGHCTISCGCCYRHRGFELQDADKKLVQPEFDISTRPLSWYSVGIFHAYIWALE